MIELDGLGFEDAVEMLADRYGIEVEREELTGEEARRRAAAKRLDARSPRSPCLPALPGDGAGGGGGRPPRGALRSPRSRPSASGSGSRRSPAGGSSRHEAKGYSDTELEAAGVARRGPGGLVDRFHGRVIFPLRDARGPRARLRRPRDGGGEGPKYLNSPQSASFDKSRLLYGLDLARASIARRGRAIVAEERVIALHAAGFEEAVGAMGTALTADSCASCAGWRRG